jgi:surface carbohydrate biosynthesis protein
MRKKSKFVCYIQYEIENRELRSRFYFALKLLTIFKFVVVFHHSQLSNIALFARPGVIFLKSTPIQHDYLLEHMVSRGFIILAWQEEGLHHKKNQLESPVFSKFSSKFISRYFAWHPVDAEFAARQGIDPKRISTSGNIRMELANSLVNNANQNEYKKNNKLRILVITNFDTRRIVYNFKKDGNISTETARRENDFVAQYKLIASKNALLYQEMINQKQASDYEFIIRPYIFERKILTHNSVKIDENNSIFETFKSIDLVLHYGSTAGIEGIVAGKLSLILTSEIETIDDRISGSSKLFTNCKSLFEFLSEIRTNPKLFERELYNQKLLLQKNYNFNFSHSTHSSDVIEFLNSFVKNELNLNYSKKIFKVFYLVYLSKFKNKVKRIMSKNYYQKSTNIDYSKAYNELATLNAGKEIGIRLKKEGKILIFSTNKI